MRNPLKVLFGVFVTWVIMGFGWLLGSSVLLKIGLSLFISSFVFIYFVYMRIGDRRMTFYKVRTIMFTGGNWDSVDTRITDLIENGWELVDKQSVGEGVVYHFRQPYPFRCYYFGGSLDGIGKAIEALIDAGGEVVEYQQSWTTTAYATVRINNPHENTTVEAERLIKSYNKLHKKDNKSCKMTSTYSFLHLHKEDGE